VVVTYVEPDEPAENPRPAPPVPPASSLPDPFGHVQLWSHPNQLIPHVAAAPAAWDSVAQSVEVFGLFVGAVKSDARGQGRDEALLVLAATGRPIALEVGGLRPFACTGVASADGDEPAFQAVEAAGFDSVYVRMDNPFTFVLAGAYHANPCQHSVQSAVDELVVYMQTVKGRHPGLAIRFGWDEAAYLHQWPGFPPKNPSVDGGDFKEIITTFLTTAAAAGVPVEYYHLDGSFNTHLAYALNQGADPWARLRETAAHVRSLGARFGVLLNFQQPCPGGCETNESGASATEFVKRTLTYYDCLVENGVALDDVVPESWWNEPAQFFPLDHPYTFGNLTFELAERLADPTNLQSCPAASFQQGRWVFSDD